MFNKASYEIYFFQPQLIFTCYIWANLGPGKIEWLNEYIRFDERLFSIIITFLRICVDRSMIHSSNMGEQKLNFTRLPGNSQKLNKIFAYLKKTSLRNLYIFSGYFYLSVLDTCLVSSMIIVFNIIFGFFATIGAVGFVGLTQALIQCCCYDNQGFRSLEQSAFSAFGPLLSIVHEIKRGRRNILLICNRLFLYFVMGLIFLGKLKIGRSALQLF